MFFPLLLTLCFAVQFQLIANVSKGFHKETPVLMADGSYKEIQNIRVGDKVKCFNLETYEKEDNFVANVLIFKNTPHKELHLYPEVIIAGEDQGFFIRSAYRCFERYVSAKHLEVDEHFLLNNKLNRMMLLLKNTHYAKDPDLYCLNVQKNHNYFVGHSQVLVSNFSEAAACTMAAGMGVADWFVVPATAVGSLLAAPLGIPLGYFVIAGAAAYLWFRCPNYSYEEIQRHCASPNHEQSSKNRIKNEEYQEMLDVSKRVTERNLLQQEKVRKEEELLRIKQEESRLLKEAESSKAAEPSVDNPGVAQGCPSPEPPKKPDDEDDENDEELDLIVDKEIRSKKINPEDFDRIANHLVKIEELLEKLLNKDSVTQTGFDKGIACCWKIIKGAFCLVGSVAALLGSVEYLYDLFLVSENTDSFKKRLQKTLRIVSKKMICLTEEIEGSQA